MRWIGARSAHVPITAGILYAAAMILVCLLPAVWPGDVPWVNDEPNLIAGALRANAAHRPAAAGLYGSFGVAYGPLPTQLYQLLLLFTHDPVTMVVVRAVATTAVTAAALAWLGRTLRLARWFVPAVLLSPYLWLFSRLLWDNTFAIPLGALAVAGYAHFLASGSGRSLVAAVACAAGLVSVHFMAAPLALAVGGHLLWRHRPALVRHRRGLLAVLALAGAANAGYFALGASKAWNHLHRAGGMTSSNAGAFAAAPASAPARADRPGRLAAALFPLLGGRLLGGEGFYVTPRGDGPVRSAMLPAAGDVSRVGELLVWMGIVVTATRLNSVWRQGEAGGARDAICGVGLAALVGQMILFAAMRVAPYAHYFNGLAVVYVLFAWVAVDAVRPGLLRAAVVGGYALSVGVFTAACAVQIHRAGGRWEHFGPSLGNQVEVAAALDAYADAEVFTDVPHYTEHPHALWTLRRLRSAPSAALSAKRPTIRYEQEGGEMARVRVVETDPPAGANRVSLSDPREWGK